MSKKIVAPRADIDRIRKANQQSRTAAATFARRSKTQRKLYVPHDFVVTSLPYKRQESLQYERRDRGLIVTITGDERWGLPFGQDRLIFYWLATAFKLVGEPSDNVLRFRAVNDILRAFQLPLSGRHRRLLKERIHRVYGCKVEVQDQKQPHRTARRQHLFIDGFRLAFDPRGSGEQTTLWQNTIKLNSHFADDIRRSAIPVDLETVIALKANVPALDLYIWQAWRSYRLHQASQSHVAVPVFGPGGLLSQFGTATKERYRARQLIRRWQAEVVNQWPECRNELSADANTLIVRPARPVDRASLELPGVSADPPVPLVIDLRGQPRWGHERESEPENRS